MRVRVRVLVCAALVLAVALAGVACASPSDVGSGPPRTPAVALVVPNTSLNFAMEIATGFGAGVRQLGNIEVQVVGPPRNDNAEQARLFGELIDSGDADDGVALFQQSADMFAPLIEKAHKKKIPMMAVDNKTDATAKIDLYVGNDNYALGQQLAAEIVKKLPRDATGQVLIGTPVPGVPVLDLRAKGIRDEFAKQMPQVEVLGPFDTKPDPLVNLSTWESLVEANPSALAYLGTADQDSVSLAAIRQRGKATWLAGAFDLDPRALEAVKNGNLVLVSPEHYVKGAVAGRLHALRARDGQPLPKGWYYIPGLSITQDNVEEVIQRQSSEAAKEGALKPVIDRIVADRATHLRPLSEAR